MFFLIGALLFLVFPQIGFGGESVHFHYRDQSVAVDLHDIDTGKRKELSSGMSTTQCAPQLHTFSDKTETVAVVTEGRTDFDETINIELPNSVKTMMLNGEKIVNNESIIFLPGITESPVENLIMSGDKHVGTIKKLLQNEKLRSFEFHA